MRDKTTDMKTYFHRSHNRNSKPAAGFTMIELIVVLAIISVLAGVVTLTVVGRQDKARVDAAKTQINALRSAVDVYRVDNGMIPTMQQGLQALVEKPATPPIPANYAREGYLRRLPLDPWGFDYIYRVPGTRNAAYEIISYGSDGQPGGEEYAADISSYDI